MPDLVRIRDKNAKTEITVGARRAEQLAARSKDVEVLDADATDRLGRALDPSPLSDAKPVKSQSKEQAR